MHLKRLEIVGFKSFADAFELQFQRGISAIVGPNGCGKSNIADSIRWVLGSQSPKQLRADRMEDVIFSGSDTRKPLGMAEVILTFDNTSRSLPIDFDEVSVTRRLFRAGEGDYRINGNRCRLMDITDLIVDRGLGSSGYWILEAKMVETILSSKPEDRRFLFDEAAGIVKYKIQRHRAELKLDAASIDLDRLNDIVCEVDRTVTSLRKQVRTFRRFEKAETKIHELEGLIVHRELEQAGKQRDDLSDQNDELAGQEEGLSAAVSVSGTRLAGSRLELEEAQTRLDEAHRKCAELDAGIADIDRDHAVTVERIAATSLSIEENAGRIEWQRERSGELAALAGAREKEIGETEEELTDLRKTAGEAGLDAARCREEYESSASALEELRNERNGIETDLDEARTRYSEIASGRERMIQDLQNRRSRREELQTKKNSLDVETSGQSERLTTILGELERSTRDIESAESGLSTASEELEKTRENLHDMEIKAGSVRTRIEGLGSSERKRSSDANALSNLLRIGESMERAVGAFLEGFQDAHLLRDVSGLSGNEGERFALGSSRNKPPDPPAGAVRLDECVENRESEIRAILAHAILAPDRTTALRWFLDPVPFDIVTVDGSLFRRDGLVRLGMPDASDGPIDRKAILAEASETLERLETGITGLGDRMIAGMTERDGFAGKVNELREERLNLERDEASLRTGLEGHRQQLASCEQEIAAQNKAIPDLEKSIAGSTGTDIQSGIDDLRDRLEQCSRKLRESETRTGPLSEALSEAERHESRHRYQVDSLEDRLKRSGEEMDRLLAEAAGAMKTAEELTQRMEELEKRKSELTEREKKLVGDRSVVLVDRKKAEEERTDASTARAGILEATGQLDSTLQELREELTLLREKRALVGSELKTLVRRILEREAREMLLPDESDRYWDLDSDGIHSEHAKQRNYRENIGPVNMLAVTEFEEVRKRLNYLSEQKEDLEEARESLRQAIDEINRTAARRFTETFGEVRKHFKELFRTLFDGGEADIVSLETDDPLEGGVQIVARPKGKKLENVTALSGGERALTAVALLFALYLVKPSPFCILDELDAPLDDSNIDRFIELLRGFSDRTQFVIITHNKRTMEAADRLFGITMAEDGVSVMTTVSLEDFPDPESG